MYRWVHSGHMYIHLDPDTPYKYILPFHAQEREWGAPTGPDTLGNQAIGQWSGTQRLCNCPVKGCSTYAARSWLPACDHTEGG